MENETTTTNTPSMLPEGMPGVQSASQSSKVGFYIKTAEELIEKCREARPAIMNYRDVLAKLGKDAADRIKATELPAVMPACRFPEGVKRCEANAEPVEVLDKQGEPQNLIYGDVDHIPDIDLYNKAIARFISLNKTGELDVVFLHASVSSGGVKGYGFHWVVSTHGIQSEDIESAQHEVYGILNVEGLEQYHDPHVKTLTALSFLPLQNEIYIISKRLFK